MAKAEISEIAILPSEIIIAIAREFRSIRQTGAISVPDRPEPQSVCWKFSQK